MKMFLASIVACLAAGVSAYGQGGLGSISGQVTDPSGAAVPGASVVVENPDTKAQARVVSGSAGYYQALSLTPGIYTVTVESTGFNKSVREGVQVQVGDRLTLDFALVVGATRETVTVTTELPLLRTEDAQLGEVINNKFIMNLPQIGRDPLSLVQLSGDVQGSGGTLRINGSRTSGVEYFQDGMPMASGRSHSVTGVRATMDDVQEFKVVTNGISAEYGRLSGGYVEVATKAGANAFHGQAFEYMYNDMFNANSWAQNALGAKKAHFRQNNYGFQLGGPVWIPKVYNGRNKTFFSFDYDIFHNTQAGVMQTSTVPTASERTGDVTDAFLTQSGAVVTPFMYDPDGGYTPQTGADGKPTGTYVRTTPLGGDGKHVPASRISPTSAAILAKLPLPNRPAQPGSIGINNYQAPRDSFSDSYKYGTRLDRNINSNHRIFGRLQLLDSQGGNTRWQGPSFTASQNGNHGGRFASINYIWTKSPTTLVTVRAGVSHNPGSSGSLLPSDFKASDIKLHPDFIALMGDNNSPNVQTDWLANGYFVNTNNGNVNVFTSYNFGVTVAKMAGRHSLRYGYEHRRYYDNFTSFGGTNVVTFDANPVRQLSGDGGFGSNESNINSLGAYLLGINDWNIQSGPQTRAMNLNYNAAFVQDDFKVNSRLTLNIGVRWDVETPTTERHDKLYFWDPDAPNPFPVNPGYSWAGALAAAKLPADTPTPAWVTKGIPNGAVRLANTPEFKGRGPQTYNPHQFAPRLGFAYSLTKKTVVRGSAGLNYLSTTGAADGYSKSNTSITTSTQANPGWHDSLDNGLHYISTWANPFPLATDITRYTRDNLTANKQSSADPGVSVFTRNSHMPREYLWNVSVQRELPARFLIEASYSGNRGLGLLAAQAISQFPKALFLPSNAATMTTLVTSPVAGQGLSNLTGGTQQKVGMLQYPYPTFGFVNLIGSNAGSSTFHGMTTRVERRFSNGISFLLNYTLSKGRDNVGGPEAGASGINSGGTGSKTVQSVDTFRQSWGTSSIDQTHRIFAAYSVELPFGRGKRWMGHPKGAGMLFADGVIGGWQLSGITSYRSGTPLFFGASNSNVNNTIKVETTFGSYTSSDHNLASSAYTGDRQVLVSSADPRTTSMPRRFDSTKITNAVSFTYGNLPSIYDAIRNPGNGQTDLSLMKKFSVFSGEGTRFLQFRMEGSNVFNIRGFGSYNTSINTTNFGLITAAGNTERRIQLSARIVF